MLDRPRPSTDEAIESARAKLGRLRSAGFELSRNDRKIVVLGQLLTTLESPDEVGHILLHSDVELSEVPAQKSNFQTLLFD